MMKFGVIRVENQPRDIIKGVFTSGNARELKADLKIISWHERSSSGELSKESKANPRDEDPIFLRWYDSEERKQMAEELVTPGGIDRFLQGIQSLDKWSSTTSIELLPVRRHAHLLVFYTSENVTGFFLTPEGGTARPLGKYKVKIGIYSNESATKEYFFELDVRGWNDFTIQEVD
jgi:hypothetical protein